MSSVGRKTWYGLVMLFLSMIAMTAASMGYSNHVAQQNSRKWCALLTTLDVAYKQLPPQSETGKRVASQIAQLRQDFGCGS